MRYRHSKTGKIYRLMTHAIDCTNSRDGTETVVYCPEDDFTEIYVREAKEFNERFTLIGESNE